MGIGEATR